MTDIWHEDRLLIDGELRPAAAGATYENVNPATEEVIGGAADASPEDVEAAIVAARRAFDETRWSTDVDFRATCLRQLHAALLDHFKELAEITIAEVGAPRAACAGVQVAIPSEFPAYYADVIERFEWSTDLGKRDTMGGPCLRWIEREAIGVVAAITPWNVPNQINLAKLTPALAAGCTAILKPAPDTPWTGLALGRIVADHTDIPAGVLNVVSSADRAIGEHLTTDPRVDMISFTGSTAVGKRVMEAASANLTKVFLELGGKSVSLVLDDVADYGMVAATAAFGTASVCGQGCALSTRILLPRSRYEEGVAAIAKMMGIIAVGDPAADGTQMGPLINRAQLERVEAYVQSGIDQGARVACGGKRPESAERGYFYEMTLLADVTNDMKVAQEEIFGPVLVAIPYDDDDHAIRIANDSIYGLSGTVFSADEKRAHALARRIRTGTMSLNGGVWYAPDVPFGGYKQSGIGREMGIAGLEEHLELKSYAKPAPS
ncbi:MAG: aldehyde dehydrogenase family protein [Deltaproteobacteria bacterium]|nr:aldehyde dehydrogenase family protein [Deltaproteobacteria bacterium]MBW2421824.1 aldehyde dehydrogenase family protein [Deltaproteobacteria bacterium]